MTRYINTIFLTSLMVLLMLAPAYSQEEEEENSLRGSSTSETSSGTERVDKDGEPIQDNSGSEMLILDGDLDTQANNVSLSNNWVLTKTPAWSQRPEGRDIFYRPDFDMFGSRLGYIQEVFQMSYGRDGNTPWYKTYFRKGESGTGDTQKNGIFIELWPAQIRFYQRTRKSSVEASAGWGLYFQSTAFSVNLANLTGVKLDFNVKKIIDTSLFVTTIFRNDQVSPGKVNGDAMLYDDNNKVALLWKVSSGLEPVDFIEKLGFTFAASANNGGYRGDQNTVEKFAGSLGIGTMYTNSKVLLGADTDLVYKNHKLHAEFNFYRDNFGWVTVDSNFQKDYAGGPMIYAGYELTDQKIGKNFNLGAALSMWLMNRRYTPDFAHMDDDNKNMLPDGTVPGLPFFVYENIAKLESITSIYGAGMNEVYNDTPDYLEDFILYDKDKYFGAPLLFEDMDNNGRIDYLEADNVRNWPLEVKPGSLGQLAQVTFGFQNLAAVTAFLKNQMITSNGNYAPDISGREPLERSWGVNLKGAAVVTAADDKTAFKFDLDLLGEFVDDNIHDDYLEQSTGDLIGDDLIHINTLVLKGKAGAKAKIDFLEVEAKYRMDVRVFNALDESIYNTNASTNFQNNDLAYSPLTGSYFVLKSRAFLKAGKYYTFIPEVKLEGELTKFGGESDESLLLSDNLKDMLSRKMAFHAILKNVVNYNKKLGALAGVHYRLQRDLDLGTSYNRLAMGTELIYYRPTNKWHSWGRGWNAKLGARYGMTIPKDSDMVSDFLVYSSFNLKF